MFVYVLGIASANHNPKPFRNPLPSALTKSRTIRPSSLATPTLNTVRATRKNECKTRMRVSLECHDGKHMRRIARSWRRKVLSRLGLCAEGTGGKFFASSASCTGVYGLIATYAKTYHVGITFKSQNHRNAPPTHDLDMAQSASWFHPAHPRRLVAELV